jgi:hypothetical protein
MDGCTRTDWVVSPSDHEERARRDAGSFKNEGLATDTVQQRRGRSGQLGTSEQLATVARRCYQRASGGVRWMGLFVWVHTHIRQPNWVMSPAGLGRGPGAHVSEGHISCRTARHVPTEARQLTNKTGRLHHSAEEEETTTDQSRGVWGVEGQRRRSCSPKLLVWFLPENKNGRRNCMSGWGDPAFRAIQTWTVDLTHRVFRHTLAHVRAMRSLTRAESR